MLNNEVGGYYSMREDINWSCIRNFSAIPQKSTFLLPGRGSFSESQVDLIETSSEGSPKLKHSYQIPFLLCDSKLIKVGPKTFLFALGHESTEKVGKESVFFFSEVDLENPKPKLKSNLKYKKVNLFAIANLDEKIYLLADHAVYCYSLASFEFQVFFEMYEKKVDYRFKEIRADPTTRKIYVTAENDLFIFDQAGADKIVLSKIYFSLII